MDILSSASTKSLDEKDVAASGAIILPDDEDERRLADMGHVQQLERNFGLLSICALGLVTTNSWAAVSSVLALGIYDGGLPGLIWGFVTVTPLNVCVGLSLAELASAYPVAGGVYHFSAEIASEEWGALLSFVTAYLNIASWILQVAGISATLGQEIVALVNMINPNIAVAPWRIFVVLEAFNLVTAVGATYGNKGIPRLNQTAFIYTTCASIVIAVTCLAMSPTKLDAGTVFVDFVNESGYTSNGLTFLIGLVNPSYGYTSLDSIIHLAEEIPRAAYNMPKAIMACVALGFVSCFSFLVCIFFSIQDLDAVLSTSTQFPLAEILRQAAGQTGGVALMIIYVGANFTALPNTQISTSRLVWAFARDDGMPFSKFFAKVDPYTKVPLNAQILVWFCAAGLGAIYIGSPFAFNTLIGSALILNFLSWGVPILANVVRGRRHFRRGPFSLPDSVGFFCNFVTLSWILLSTIFWCFPYALPFDSGSMNYSSAVVGGTIVLAIAGWFLGGSRKFRPPGKNSAAHLASEMARLEGHTSKQM